MSGIVNDIHLLDKIGERCRTDKCASYSPHNPGDGHGYCDIYQRYFDPELKATAERMLEIGVASGASLRMWAEYFDKAVIYGFDKRKIATFPNPRIVVFRGNQAVRTNLQQVVLQVGKPFDIIIDDGGHKMYQQQASLGYLFQFVKPGGVYVIEDLYTSYVGNLVKGSLLPNWPTIKILRAIQAEEPFESKYMTLTEQKLLVSSADVTIEQGLKSPIAFIRKRWLSI